MSWLQKRLRDRARKALLDDITFDESGLTAAEAHGTTRVWRTQEGDWICLDFFALPPDLPQAFTFPEFEAAYRGMAEAAGARVVDLLICTIDGCGMVRSIVKVPQAPSGMIYVGVFTIPFESFSWTVTVECVEHGLTGVRDAVLLMEASKEGTVGFENDRITGDWDPDNEKFDERFPEHPLSRLRRHLSSVQATLKVDDRVKGKPPFPLPV